MPGCLDAFVPSHVLIIDTYNVLHAAATVHPDLAGLTLPGLIRLIQGSRWGGGGGGGVKLICDGTGGRGKVDDSFLHPEAPIRVVFAGPGKDADSAIERMVVDAEGRGGQGGGAITVVSSDKGVLASAVGPVGPKARRMSSEQFIKALLDDARRGGGDGRVGGASRPDSLDRESVADWVRRFGVADDRSPGGASPTQPPSAKQDWPGGINPDDLDMAKWLGEPPRK